MKQLSPCIRIVELKLSYHGIGKDEIQEFLLKEIPMIGNLFCTLSFD